MPLQAGLLQQAAQQLALQRQLRHATAAPGAGRFNGRAVGGGQQHRVGPGAGGFFPQRGVVVGGVAAVGVERPAQGQPQPGGVERGPVGRRRAEAVVQQITLQRQVQGPAAQGQRGGHPAQGLQVGSAGIGQVGKAQRHVLVDLRIVPVAQRHGQGHQRGQAPGVAGPDAQQQRQWHALPAGRHVGVQGVHHLGGTGRAGIGMGHLQLVQAVQQQARSQPLAGPGATALQ